MMGQLACNEGRGHTLHIIHLACTTHSPFTALSLFCLAPAIRVDNGGSIATTGG